MNSKDRQVVTPFTRRVLRAKEVAEKMGIPSSALFREVRAGRFPQPFKLFADPKRRAIGWLESDVDAHLEERAKAGAL